MLPNWLYGKSKSKLASILGGGGGGTPADYNQVKAQVTQNTEDIGILSNTKAALTQISNRNLLDNPWFTVNQRGQSSYSYSDGSRNYTVDRWFNNYPDGVVTVSNGVTLNNYKWFCQPLDADIVDLLDGKIVTASVMLSDGTIISGTKVFHADNAITYEQIKSDEKAFIRTSNLNNMIVFEVVNFDPSQGDNLTIRAVKLELGSVSTLVMDTAPNYTTELLKCQRYFVRIDNTSGGIALGTAVALNADRAAICVKLPVSMRNKPALTGLSNLQVVNGVSTITPESMASSSHNNGYETLSVVATGTTQGTTYLVRLASNSYIDFDADL